MGIIYFTKIWNPLVVLTIPETTMIVTMIQWLLSEAHDSLFEPHRGRMLYHHRVSGILWRAFFLLIHSGDNHP